jgi:molybdopterin-guanine dinucleotide biosynthesis protein A
MGRDKAALWVQDAPLAQRAADRLAAVCPEVALADRGRGLVPGFPSLPDGPGAGPAAGLLGAALTYPGRYLLTLACDLPGVPEALLADLTRFHEGHDWAVPRWSGPEGGDRLEPLCALYSPAALAALERRANAGRMALKWLAEEPELRVRFLEGEALEAYGRPEEVFFNLNTPEDLAGWGRLQANR